MGLTREIIEAAIDGFETQKRDLENQIAGLRQMLNGSSTASTASTATPGVKAPRRKFSAATRQRMREAQRQRWAKIRGEEAPQSKAQAPKPKRRISEEGMKRIIAATKKRWAAVRAAKGKQQRAAKTGRKAA